jgi:hypothetical protein
VQESAQLADSPTRAPLSARQVAPAQVDSVVKISFITVQSFAFGNFNNLQNVLYLSVAR